MRRENFLKLAELVAVIVLVIALGFPQLSAAQKPIKIGEPSGYTGTYAAMGQHQKWSTELALEEINAKGGVLGRKLEVIYEDDQNSPALSATKVEKLILQDGVDFLMAPISSACTLNVMKIAEKHKKVMMVGISQTAKITTEDCNRYTFRSLDNPIIEANAFVDWALKNLGKKIYFLTVDYAWGTSTADEYRKAIDRLGGTILGETRFPLETKDFAPYFGKIKAAQPEVLFLVAAGNDGISAVAQLNQYGLKKMMKIAGPGSLVAGDVFPAMGDTADGIYFVDRYSPGIPTPENKAFVEKFEKRYKELPSKFAASNYEGLLWLAQGIEQAKSIESEAVIKALEGSTFIGPQGPKKMRAGDHQPIIDMYIMKVEGKKQVIIDKKNGEEVIHPNLCNKW
jgi:branched-chain amino acid transport system substrate-binding protein